MQVKQWPGKLWSGLTNVCSKARIRKTKSGSRRSQEPWTRSAQSWLQDNALSLAILVGCPVAIAAFYWAKGEPAPPATPKYLAVEEVVLTPEGLPIADQSAPVENVLPDYSRDSVDLMSSNTPQPSMPAQLTIPETITLPENGVADLEPPREIAVWNPQPIAPPQPMSQNVGFSSQFPAPTNTVSGGRSSQCVWLTGGIEE